MSRSFCVLFLHVYRGCREVSMRTRSVAAGIMLSSVIIGFFLHPVSHVDPTFVAIAGAIAGPLPSMPATCCVCHVQSPSSPTTYCLEVMAVIILIVVFVRWQCARCWCWATVFLLDDPHDVEGALHKVLRRGHLERRFPRLMSMRMLGLLV